MKTPAINMTAGQTSRRRGLALALLCAVQFMVVLDISIVNIALPSIQQELGFSQHNLQWVVSGYALTFGGCLMLAGRAADLFGRRRFFMIGLGLFTLASLVGGFAPSQAVLLIARVAQGFGAAIVSPAALSLLTTTFAEGEERNRAMGVWGAVAAGGAAAGLLLGGILTDQFGWAWVFFVNVPVGVLAVALAPMLLIESRNRDAVGRLDIAGAVTITGGLVLLVYGLTQATDVGFGSPRTLGVLGLAMALIVGFRFVEGRVADPLVPFQIFRRRTLTVANLVTILLAAVIASHGFSTTLYLQQVLGYSPIATGLAFLPLTLMIMATAGFGARFIGRLGLRAVVVSGMSLLAVGMGLMTRISAEGRYIGTLLPAFLVIAIGMGMTFVTTTIAATSGVPDNQQGLASGLINTAQQIGSALGLAVMVSLAVARTNILLAAGSLPPDALVAGFRAAFAASAGLAALGALIAYGALHQDRGTIGEVPPGVAPRSAASQPQHQEERRQARARR